MHASMHASMHPCMHACTELEIFSVVHTIYGWRSSLSCFTQVHIHTWRSSLWFFSVFLSSLSFFILLFIYVDGDLLCCYVFVRHVLILPFNLLGHSYCMKKALGIGFVFLLFSHHGQLFYPNNAWICMGTYFILFMHGYVHIRAFKNRFNKASIHGHIGLFRGLSGLPWP